MKTGYIRQISMALLILAFLLPAAVSAFTCQVTDSCSGTDQEIIFRLSADDNAHGGTATGSSYGRLVCCEDGYTDVGSDCSAPITEAALRLSAADNAHAEEPLGASGFSSPVDVCLSADTGEPFCSLVDSQSPTFTGDCPATTECLATLSSLGNAHLGDCIDPTYRYWLCCRVNRRPSVDEIFPTPGTFRGDIEFNVSADDPDDNDDVDQVLYVITDSGGSLVFSVLLCSASGPGCTLVAPTMQWNHTWATFPAIASQENNLDVGVMARAGGEWSDWRNETFSIDNTPPEAWITGPDDGSWVGRVFNVTLAGNPYAYAYDFEYADRANFPSPPGPGWSGNQYGLTQDFYQINLSESSYITGDNPQYCYRVLAVDDGNLVQDPTDWSCSDPAVDDCNCSTVDTSPPWVSSIASNPMYTNRDSFDVDWLGADTGSGLKCYQIEYKVTNIKDNTLTKDWYPWSDINDISQVLALNDETKGCEYVSCVDRDTLSEMFDQYDVEGTRKDNRTYTFRARAIDNVDAGCANIGDWEVAAENTSIDKNPPPSITVTATNNLGQDVPDGDTVMTGTTVSFSVAADPGDDDYTGVSETGVIYWMYRLGSGYLVQGPEILPPCAGNTCTVTETWEDDYNITYMAYADDRAGNRGETEKHSFAVFKPFDISTASSNIYMTLGSYDILPIVVANRQDITESVSIRMLDDYQLARFVDVSEGELMDGNRTLNLTLLAKETKTVHAVIYTYDIGDSYTLTLLANSTRSPEAALEITDMEILDINVVFPPNFSGLSWAGVTALFAFAALLYFRYGTER